MNALGQGRPRRGGHHRRPRSACATSRSRSTWRSSAAPSPIAHGNVSLDQEPANLDIYAVALAAHNSGGKVIVQVRTAVEVGRCRRGGARAGRPRRCRRGRPRPAHRLRRRLRSDPLRREPQGPRAPRPRSLSPCGRSSRRRAAEELARRRRAQLRLRHPRRVAKIVSPRGQRDRYYQTIEHGTYGGDAARRLAVRLRAQSHRHDRRARRSSTSTPAAASTSPFSASVRSTRSATSTCRSSAACTVGPGGFIDIAQNARKVVFCGAFDAKGTEPRDGRRLAAHPQHGEVQKLVHRVEQITCSGPQCAARRARRCSTSPSARCSG